MQHCDDDTLTLMALGESMDNADEAHVQQCARCQSRVDQLAAVVATVRSLGPDDGPQDPPASVWAGITGELGLDEPAGATVTSIDVARRRRSGRWWLTAAAAAVVGIALGSAVTLGLQRSGSSADVVAQGALAPIGTSDLSGSASVQRVDGQSVLVVSVPKLPTAGTGYYEVWMATPDTSTMVAMGSLNPGHEGRFLLPDGLDPKAFPVVDVSLEQFDGDNSHSATSVVRGKLTV